MDPCRCHGEPVPAARARTTKTVRFCWIIRGQVQGVGFRPFVFRTAQRAGVTGWVRNDAQGVRLEIQGTRAAVDRFARAFSRALPPLARIDGITRRRIAVVRRAVRFRIIASESRGAGDVVAAVTVDSAVCPECLREMYTPSDRRFRHGLINCTNCGPRFSIIRDIPYDRPNTTMAAFRMCRECRAEYENPADRRFHAQPVCCPRCGPQVELVRVERRASGACATRPVRGDPFAEAAQLLLDGRIVALKGLGGFHLAVRADDPAAVARLRMLKKRDAKPFALMCRDLAHARRLVRLSPGGAAELRSIRAPILLARRIAPPALVAEAVAPGTHRLGVMLPYTPIHHLVWAALGALMGAPPALVMTSGNLSDEPLVIDNADAVVRLGPLCDAILWHDRPIERCVDDSVILDRGPGRRTLPIRRSRGYAPTPTPLPGPGVTGICVGGELKNTLGVVRRDDVILSQHFGDLTHALSLAQFEKALEDLVRLFDVKVQFVAHDLHPAYLSTVAAKKLAARCRIPLIAIQHHHAHAAAVLAEHNLAGPTLCLVCDGTGYGPDGTIWGGEILLVDGARYERLGRLRPIRLPGGDAAARDTRRSGLSLLHLAYGEDFDRHPAAQRLVSDPAERQTLGAMIRTGTSSPWTSSTGRVFDGVAALLGICQHNQHEAQAALRLEALAVAHEGEERARDKLFDVVWNSAQRLWELDLGAFIRVIATEVPTPEAIGARAWAFHQQLASGLLALAARCKVGRGRAALACSGGVFCNQVLEKLVRGMGHGGGFRTFFHKLYPPTDAGLAFGQAAISRFSSLTTP